ncbi:MAG: hypothetical protein ACRDIV_08070 [Ktedonobacteraceae bacterium]
MLLLKLILTPLLLGGVTLAGRKFGPTVSGWLVGLPLTSGPVTFFLALEQGRTFAAHAAQGTLMGVISLSAFCVVYCWLTLRTGWLLCWIGSWGAYLASTFLFTRIIFPLPLDLLLAVCVLVVSLYILPQDNKHASKPAPATISATWDMALRMLIATLFVLTLTGAAGALGPRLSGLLSPLPIFSSIVAIFAHKFEGAAAARLVLRGILAGSFAYVAFYLAITTLIVPWGIIAAFGCALLGALLAQGCSLWFLSKRHVARAGG